MQHHWKKSLGILLLGGVFSSLAATTPAFAEEIKTPVMAQGGDRSMMEMPRHGEEMSSVESRFGSPSNVRGPVGTPPIITWEYPRYTVYFEGDKVIHAVLKSSTK